MKTRLLIAMLTLTFAASCASVNSVSLTQIPAKRKARVSAQVSKMIFLGFNFDNDFVDNLSQKLRNQCENGKIQGILTKHETTFYVFLHRTKVTATGYCVRS